MTESQANTADLPDPRSTVFISWSGEKSKRAARLFKRWLKTVIPDTEPWVSSEDIAKGANWNSELRATLTKCRIGIVCLTRENAKSTWMNFESGFLAKSVDDNSRVIPVLIDMQTTDVPSTYAQFQYSTMSKEELMKVIVSINSLSPKPLDRADLAESFDLTWDGFQRELDEIVISDYGSFDEGELKPPDQDSVLADILEQVRGLTRMLNDSAPRVFPRERHGGQEGVRIYVRGDIVRHSQYGMGEITNAYYEQFDSYNSDDYQTIEVFFKSAGIIKFHAESVGRALEYIPQELPSEEMDDIPF